MKLKTKSEELLSARELLNSDDRSFTSNTLDIPDEAPVFRLDSKKPRKIDLVPYLAGKNNTQKTEGETVLFRSYLVHYGVGPEQKSEICPRSFEKRCPICEDFDKLSWDEKKEDAGKALKAKKRQLWNVIDLENKEAGIQIWDMSDWLFGEPLRVADRSLEEDSPYFYYAAPTQGASLKLTVSEQSIGGRAYFKVERVDFFSRKEQYKDSIKKKAYCLDDVLKPALSYKNLKAIFLQTSDTEEDETDSSDNSPEKRNGSMNRKSVTAKSKKIKEGSTVEHEDLMKCVVSKISKDGFTVTLEDTDGDEHAGIGVAEIELTEEKVAVKKGKKAAPVAKKGKKAVEVDEDEDDSDDSELEDDDDSELEDDDDSSETEDEEGDDEDSDEEDSETEDDDDSSDLEDDEDSSDLEDDEDSEIDEEDEPAPKKRGRGRPAKVAPKKGKK